MIEVIVFILFACLAIILMNVGLFKVNISFGRYCVFLLGIWLCFNALLFAGIPREIVKKGFRPESAVKSWQYQIKTSRIVQFNNRPALLLDLYNNEYKIIPIEKIYGPVPNLPSVLNELTNDYSNKWITFDTISQKSEFYSLE